MSDSTAARQATVHALRDALCALAVEANIEELDVTIILAWPDHDARAVRCVVACNNPPHLNDLLDMARPEHATTHDTIRLRREVPS